MSAVTSCLARRRLRHCLSAAMPTMQQTSQHRSSLLTVARTCLHVGRRPADRQQGLPGCCRRHPGRRGLPRRNRPRAAVHQGVQSASCSTDCCAVCRHVCWSCQLQCSFGGREKHMLREHRICAIACSCDLRGAADPLLYLLPPGRHEDRPVSRTHPCEAYVHELFLVPQASVLLSGKQTPEKNLSADYTASINQVRRQGVHHRERHLQAPRLRWRRQGPGHSHHDQQHGQQHCSQ